MRKFKIALPIVTLLYLFIGAFFFISTYSADEGMPTTPTFYGYGVYATPGGNAELQIEMFNPPLNYSEFPDNPEAWIGKKICSVEVGLSFPKDLIEVQAISPGGENTYSNETGTISWKDTFSPCVTGYYPSLFSISFITKQLGEGAISFSKHSVIGDEDGITPISSSVYSNIEVYIYSPEQYETDPPVEEPISVLPPSVPQPKVKIVEKKSSSSASATAKTATKIENKAFKTPTLSKLEFGQNAVLDKANSKSQGAVFTGTAEPNSKVYLLLHSQAEIYTDTTSGADGTWTKTIDSWLEDGGHTVTVWSEKDNKISPKFVSPFVLSSYAKDQIAIGETYPEYKGGEAVDTNLKTKKESKLNTIMKNKYFWPYVGGGFVLIVISIILIIKSRRKNNDIDDENLGESGGFINSSAMPPKSTSDQGSTDKIYPNTDI